MKKDAIKQRNVCIDLLYYIGVTQIHPVSAKRSRIFTHKFLLHKFLLHMVILFKVSSNLEQDIL